jgi:hypothetical protein
MSDTQVLDTARKYYDEVLKAQYDEFFTQPATFRNLINLASSLFHFHEWLFVEFSPELQIKFGQPQPIANASAFWKLVEATNSKFGFVRDIANASKHVKLTRNPSTTITHMANTVIQVAKWDTGLKWDSGAKWDTPSVISKHGSNDVLFDTCAEELFRYWTNLIDKLSSP